MTVTTLSAALAAQQLRPLGTIVHIGTRDPDAMGAFLALDAQRIVLVTPHAEIATALRERSPAAGTAVEVLFSAVAELPGRLPWYECVPSEASGALLPEGLGVYFPRARVLRTEDLAAVGIADLLQAHAPAPDDLSPNLLVLDEPGRASALLAAVPQETLLRFDWVAVRCARDGVFAGGEPTTAAPRLLRALHYEEQATPSAADPLWPLLLFRRDRTAATRIEQLQVEVQALRDLLQEREAALALASEARIQSASSSSELEAERRRAGELQEALTALRAEHERQGRLQRALEAELSTATNQLELFEGLFMRSRGT